jgi:hypothetical protein
LKNLEKIKKVFINSNKKFDIKFLKKFFIKKNYSVYVGNKISINKTIVENYNSIVCINNEKFINNILKKKIQNNFKQDLSLVFIYLVSESFQLQKNLNKYSRILGKRLGKLNIRFNSIIINQNTLKKNNFKDLAYYVEFLSSSSSSYMSGTCVDLDD